MQRITELLRLPEGELWLSDAAIELAGKQSRALIRRNFPELDIDLHAPVDWDVDPERNVTWRLYYCCMGWVAPFAKLGHERAEYAAFAKACVLSAAQYALDHDPVDNNGYWNDHAVAYRGSYIGFIYADLVQGLLTPEEDALLRAAMAKHQDILVGFLDSDKWLLSNHTLFHAEGLADLILTFEPDETIRNKKLREVARYVGDFANRVITSDEGTVKEHALFYHAFLMGRLKQTSDFLARMGVNETIVAERTYRRMKAFLYRVMPVNGYLPGVGDSKHHQKFDQKHIASFRSMKYDSPETQQFDLKRKPQDFPGDKPAYLGSYPTDGFFISRSYNKNELYSVFLHKPFKGPHGHWDALSFISYHKGQPVFIDSGGPYKYGDQLRYRYIQTQLAHNTLIQDGVVSQYYSRMLIADHDADSSVLVGGTRLTQDLYWVRAFVQIADFCQVVVDWPIETAPLESPVNARFHVDPDLMIAQEDGSLRLTREGAFIAQITSHVLEAPADFTPQVEALSDLEFELQPPLEPGRRRRLPENFEKRSFVTYKDNLLVDGQLVDLPATPGVLNARIVSFVDGLRVDCDAGKGALQITLRKRGYKKSVTVDLAGMRVSKRETRHG
jgi:hypothetical protein